MTVGIPSASWSRGEGVWGNTRRIHKKARCVGMRHHRYHDSYTWTVGDDHEMEICHDFTKVHSLQGVVN